MSEVTKVQSLFFSPTGTTRKIIKAIERNTGLQRAKSIDITLPKERARYSGAVDGDLLLVGMPVYHESPPWPTLDVLDKLQGDGKWAVPIAVYGNRTEGTCVEEMGKILKSRGFKILAAAAFVAEHSWANKDRPFALGRPDRSDMKVATGFGKRIASKLSLFPAEIYLSSRLQSYFTHKEVESFPQGYHKDAVASLKSLGGISYDNIGCSNCQNCVEVCPTGALSMDPYRLDEENCIKCVACARSCPTGALSLQIIGSDQNNERMNRLGRIFSIRREPITRL